MSCMIFFHSHRSDKSLIVKIHTCSPSFTRYLFIFNTYYYVWYRFGPLVELKKATRIKWWICFPVNNKNLAYSLEKTYLRWRASDGGGDGNDSSEPRGGYTLRHQWFHGGASCGSGVETRLTRTGRKMGTPACAGLETSSRCFWQVRAWDAVQSKLIVSQYFIIKSPLYLKIFFTEERPYFDSKCYRKWKVQ